ncbi:MAG TPA: beta-N-acetylhexosaminidase [Gammaproteobacteria bacterium]|nr:beta-N-acetylhexosaminidase [Gammaproteobacteria bacterium]
MKELEIKIGQMLMVGLSGHELTTAELKICQSHNFGGFILFSRNCCDLAQIRSLCRSLCQVTSDTPFIAIDEEGGSVHRLPSPFTHFPPAARIGKTGNLDLAFRVGRAIAAELTLVGINLNFAPVLDVNSNAGNPIIGDRSFGTTPKQVAAMALAWSDGLRSMGIIPCGKHFPGHGHTDTDSHLQLPRVTKSLSELHAVELKPFLDACRGRIEALMTAHVVFPALDEELPATLSSRIVTGVLRQEFGYKGVVFSDDMEMKAISGNFDAGEAAVSSVRAGIDVLLYCHDLAKAAGIVELLCREARDDSQLLARIEESHARIDIIKKRCLRRHGSLPDNGLLEHLIARDHRKLVDEIHGS